jgi:predicted small lipoprotein YifL
MMELLRTSGSAHMKVACKFSILFLAALLLLLPACGRKGPLSLKSWEKPPAPVLLGAYHRENRVTISWSFPEDKEEDIQDFVLLRATDKSFEKIAFPEDNQRSFTDTGFKEGAHYRYKIVARNLRGVLSKDSNILSLTPLPPPPPPANISFKIKGNSTVLSWENEGQNVRYNVYKGFEKGKTAPSPLNASPLTEPSFTDAFDINRTAYYAIRSVVMSDMVNEGPPAPEIEVNPADLVPSAPVNLKAFPASDRVVLYWEASPEPWVTKYKIYRRSDGGDYSVIGETQIPTFIDMGRPSTKRDYKVTAVGPAKEGPAAVINGVVYVPQE